MKTGVLTSQKKIVMGDLIARKCLRFRVKKRGQQKAAIHYFVFEVQANDISSLGIFFPSYCLSHLRFKRGLILSDYRQLEENLTEGAKIHCRDSVGVGGKCEYSI